MNDREAAWSAIHDGLPPRWRGGPPVYDPATRRWDMVALAPTGCRRKVWRQPESVTGTGADESEALRDLAERLASVGT